MKEPQGARFDFEGRQMTVAEVRKEFLPAYSRSTIRRYLLNGVNTRQAFLAESVKMHAKISSSGMQNSKKLSEFTLERRLTVKHKIESRGNE